MSKIPLLKETNVILLSKDQINQVKKENSFVLVNNNKLIAGFDTFMNPFQSSPSLNFVI